MLFEKFLPLWMLTPKAKQARVDAMLAAFPSWVATKPPHEEYSYTDPVGCALAQYLRSLGYRPSVGPHAFSLRLFGPDYPIPRNMGRALTISRTFGELDAALSKAGA